MGANVVYMPLAAAAFREVDILGVFRYANTYKAAIELMGSGALKGVDKLVTHRYKLDQCADAFSLVARGRDEKGNLVIKAMVSMEAS
jgi:L-iditol 2-dehydrogenase